MKNQEAWLGFDDTSPPHLIGIRPMPPAGKAPPKNQVKKLSDLTISNGITYQQVTKVWGRPDAFGGSGISYYIYQLEDGHEVWLEFDFEPPYRCLGGSSFYKNLEKHFF
jgi:hypothetical protein